MLSRKEIEERLKMCDVAIAGLLAMTTLGGNDG